MGAGERQRLAVDLEELATAFENGFPELSYYLDLDSGAVVMVSDETRSELETLYAEVAGAADVDEAALAAAIQRRDLPDWQRAALEEADRVERGLGADQGGMRFVAVPRDDTHEAYRDMEDFIPTIADGRLRERLWDAIDGRGAFGRFKRVLSAHDAERERWFTFRDARLRERIVAWLEDEGIEAIGT